MNLHWMLRAKRWAQNPPSAKQVKFVLAIIAVCIALFAYERIMGWPDWLTPNNVGRMPR
ncbi:hypothetical protein [Palleronia pelagia]|uniref:Uncharacterized protein n=1 Tax=Palleronia pelagia TaxID=387096 RepID=A0A1H8BWJ0_9RHOB|nr:hypothetical protein [Palleronia pelagia]SEM87156.1 hypothetical protein SAMN04488011_101756 [Palleronia pelagia]